MSTPAKQHNAGFLALVTDAKSRVKEIDIEAYRRMAVSGEEFLTVDVREEREWAAGHAAGLPAMLATNRFRGPRTDAVSRQT